MVRIVPVILALPFPGRSGADPEVIGDAMSKTSDSRVFETPIMVCSDVPDQHAEGAPRDTALLLVPNPSSGAFAAAAGCLLAGRRFPGAAVLLLAPSSNRSDLSDYTRDVVAAARSAGTDGVVALSRTGRVRTGDYVLTCSSELSLSRKLDRNLVRFVQSALDSASDDGGRVTLADTPYFAGAWPIVDQAFETAGIPVERFCHRDAPPPRELYTPWRTYDGAVGFYAARNL